MPPGLFQAALATEYEMFRESCCARPRRVSGAASVTYPSFITAGRLLLTESLTLVSERTDILDTERTYFHYVVCSVQYRCFQFDSLSRARSQKCTSVLLLPGCCSQNTSDSRASVGTGVSKPKPPVITDGGAALPVHTCLHSCNYDVAVSHVRTVTLTC